MANIIGLRIPPNYQLGLAKVISLNNESIAEIITLLENVSIDSKKSIEALAANAQTISAEDAEKIIETIYSLYQLKNQIPLSEFDDFSDVIIDAMNDSENEALKLSDENLADFKQKFSALLNVNSLSIRTKAQNLRLEHANVLKDMSLITDLRPIFGDNVDENPVGIVLVHTLKIVYEQNDESMNFYFALDDDDLTEFISVLKRAQIKSESLRKFADKTGLHSFDIN